MVTIEEMKRWKRILGIDFSRILRRIERYYLD